MLPQYNQIYRGRQHLPDEFLLLIESFLKEMFQLLIVQFYMKSKSK